MPDRSVQNPHHQLLVRAFQDAPAAIAVHQGPEHVFVFANKLFVQSGDGRPLIGRPYAEAFPEFVAQGYLAIFDGVFQSGKPFIANAARADTPRARGGPPEERYWNLTFQPNFGEDGAVEGLTTFAFEVTQHVLAQREAEAAGARYDELVEKLGVVVWSADPADWQLRWIRGPASALYGGSASTATSAWQLLDELSEEGRSAIEAARRGLVGAGDSYRVEASLKAEADAPERTVSELVLLRPDPDSGRLLAWGLAQDVTDRIAAAREQSRLQAQLLHVQKSESLGVLAGAIAHDFNNLLTAILGNASLAELQTPPGAPAARSITAMIAAARRASDLTRQLLAFSGRGHFRVESTDVNALLSELTILLQASIPKHVHLRLEDDPRLPRVEADGSQLTQIFMNLVINGAEAIGERGGTVVVRTGTADLGPEDIRQRGPFSQAKPGRYVTVEVSDTGHGMDAATAARIFDPFFTTKQSGHGLGLAAVQGIVRGHQGMIGVYSEPGRGTTIKVYFPAGESPATADLSPAPAEAARPTVLLVDDEESVRSCARSALEFGGYRVIEANDGHEAVEAFRALAEEVDLVLLDLTMPRLNGAEAMLQIRKIRGTIPIVLSSGYNEVEATRRLVGKGNVEFLQKPYAVRELLELLRRILGDRAPR